MVNLKKVLVVIVLASVVGAIGGQGLAAESGATKTEYQSVFKSPQAEAAYRAGYSQGGFFTTIYALQKPERLKKIVLCSPGSHSGPFW